MMNADAVSPARPVALITGASAGIGYEFGLQLAAAGYDVILVARRADRLEKLAAIVRETHGSRAETIGADLADAASCAAIVAEVARLGMSVTLLVNNAGFGTSGYFETLAADRERDEIAVNVTSVVALTHAFLPGMLERKTGGVINVASTAAFQPVPYMAVYGATKAFVRSFSEALNEEVHARGVRVLALCPGVTSTEFFDSGVAKIQGPIRTARDVVMTALTAYNAGTAVVVDGGINNAVTTLSGLFPSAWKTKIAARIMKPKA